MLKLWLLFLLLSHNAYSGQDVSPVCSGNYCNCSYNSLSAGYTAVCRLSDLKNLEKEIKAPDRIESLIVRLNETKIIEDYTFTRFENLVHLSLAKTGISKITPKAFEGLVKLKTLNLSLNNLANWNSELTNQLPSLQKIDVTGNKNWTTSGHVLNLRELQEIDGLFINENCPSCRILKSNRVLKEYHGLGLKFITNRSFVIQIECVEKTFSLKTSYNDLTQNNLFPACAIEDKHCQNSLGTITETNPCLRIARMLFIACFPIGIIVVVLNLIVVVVTLSSKSLRQHPYLVLVSFLALGDLVAGVYCIAMATVYQMVPLMEFQAKRNEFCPYIGFLVVSAQVSSTSTSVLLTIERYLTTVFWFKRNCRMKMKHVLTTSFLSYISLMAFSVLTVDNEAMAAGFVGYGCYPAFIDFNDEVHGVSSIIAVTITFILYLTSIGMYSHIYVVVRHSSRRIGRKAREVRLAKRIGIVVFSNFIFVFLPFAFVLVVIATGSFGGTSIEVSVGIVLGCLAILPGMNSILNPVMYGYRNDMFQKSLRRRADRFSLRANNSMRQGGKNRLNSSSIIRLAHFKYADKANKTWIKSKQNNDRGTDLS